MTRRPVVDTAASVRQRLLNIARDKDRPFNEVLQYFAMERFLYRLGKSEHGWKFILKGALMLVAWEAPLARSTKDIDLLGRMNNTIEDVVDAIKAACSLEVIPDGMLFDVKSVAGQRIAEKFEAMVKLGILNSRMKDFFDIWLLSRQFEFNGRTLSDAIRETFSHRETEVSVSPVAFTKAFSDDPAKILQWRAFVRKSRIPAMTSTAVSQQSSHLAPTC